MSIDQAFIDMYDADVHIAYQQYGSKFRDFVRKKTGQKGASVTFQKFGKGDATQKPRHGNVVPMNPNHTNAKAVLEDWYAPAYVDTFDEYKTNIDEKNAILQVGAGAIGRKMDSLIIDAAYTSTNIVDQSANKFSLDVLLKGIENFMGSDVFEGNDHQVTVALRTPQWMQLYKIDEFKNADYRKMTGEMDKKIAGVKQFMNINFIHSNLLTSAASVSDCLMFDRRALGLAEAEYVKTEINYIPEKVSNLVNSMMSAGATLIDEEGCAILKIQD